MYKSEIIEKSAEISKIEAVSLKNLTDAVGLDTLVNESADGYAIITPAKYVVVHVENDKSKNNREYDVLVIVDEYGNKYKTGSESFMRTFMDIFNELDGEIGWSIKVFGKDSKNFSGKKFLTCSVVYNV